MQADWWHIAQGIGVGILLVVLTQVTIERISARLEIRDTQSVAVLSAFASVYVSVIPQMHYFGAKPFPNLITTPVCLTLLMLALVFLTFLSSEPIGPPSTSATLSSSTLGAQIRAKRGWAMRTALVALTATVLRSGSTFPN